MQIKFSDNRNINEINNKVLVSLVTEEFFKKEKESNKSNDYCILREAEEDVNFSGKSGQIYIASERNKRNYTRVLMIGLGKEKDLDLVLVQNAGYKLYKTLNSEKIYNASVVVNTGVCSSQSLILCDKIGKITASFFVANIAFGLSMSNYSFNQYLTGEKAKNKELKIKNIEFISSGKKANEEFKKLEIIKDNVFYARDLVETPSNDLNPESYAKKCQELKKLGVEVEVLSEKEMKKLGMGSLLCVGQGSDYESHLVVMKWNGSKNKNSAPVSFVGKGVTFDTGGVNIKPSGGIETMKIDMGGSAVVVSLMRLLAMRKASVNAVGVIALVENMCSSRAIKPGDIVKSMSGQTIEIMNTDAEGRLILADALYYTATKFKPKLMIDLATLTGAVGVAIGEKYAGLFTRNNMLEKEINLSAEKTGEAVWRLPLHEIGEEYDKDIDSDIADMKNLGFKRQAGSTAAAQFLQRFTDKHTKWAHLDIAYTAYLEKEGYFVKNKATGYGVRLLNQLVEDNYED